MKGNSIKTILKKQLISICVVIMLSCTLFANYAHAGVGGLLLSPIVDFTAFIGDTVLYLIQETVLGMSGNFGAETVEDDFLMHKYDDEEMKPFKPANFSGSGNLKEYKTGPEANDYIKDSDMDHGFFGFLSYKYPTIYLSPAEIFAGRVEMFDIDFISAKDDSTSLVPTEALHKTISDWYATLRNFALAGMLCVLIYVGIRIIISSSAKDTSKYKSMLTDWIVAMCLLFFIHYLILLLVTLTKEITYLFGTAATSSNYMLVKVVGGSGGDKAFVTNQMGLARFLVQYNKWSVRTAYLLIYIALVGFTFYYSFIYIKRTLMMALLTLSAPIICLMYPIDKIGDGSAQTFKNWFNEVLYTCLLQPLHLVLYTIFIGGATQLAMSNPLYAVAVLFFLIPAEKFFKSMLGFDRKAKNVGSSPAIAGAVGGFMAGQAKKMLGAGKKKDGSGTGDGSGDGSGDGGDGSGKIRQNKNNTQSKKNGKNSGPKSKEEYAYDYEAFKKKTKDTWGKMKTTDGRIELYEGAMRKAGKPFAAAKDKIVGAGTAAKNYFKDKDGNFSLDNLGRDAYTAARKTGAAAKSAAKTTIKKAPKTIARVGGKAMGMYAGAILGAGYAAAKGDPDPTQEMLLGAAGGYAVGGKVADNLTPAAVSGARTPASVNADNNDFKKIGNQLGDEIDNAVRNVSIKPQIDMSAIENAINSTLGAGFSVDRMGLQNVVNNLNGSGKLDGSASDIETITSALTEKDPTTGKAAVQLHTATGDIDFSAKIDSSVIDQFKNSLAGFEIEKVGVGNIDVNGITSQINSALASAGKDYMVGDQVSIQANIKDVSFKAGDMDKVHNQLADQVRNADTKLK